eukprot:m.39995 g.39995  ORF g.39995 m.39995 type:complete len:549 (-) comp11678_c0_seq1:123-1769(-)
MKSSSSQRLAMRLLVLLQLSLILCVQAAKQPNILFVIDESTDAKAYFVENPDKAPMDLPHLRRLMNEGTSFQQHYVQAPVCCPSRASTWSGRHPHRLPHMQVNPSTGLLVNGAWNNHEGLPADYNYTYADVLGRNGFNVGIFGKLDYTAGGHTVDARVTAWTNKVKFPYTLANHSAGWWDESGPVYSTVPGADGGRMVHLPDWASASEIASFIKNASQSETPWLGYVGFNIVHPDYVTSQYWLDRVNRSKVTIPQWIPISQMHPEDLQSSMKKHMASDLCCNDTFKVDVRQHYYAMIAEYDAILGTVLDAVDDAGVWNNTYMIVTSDHGDMNMEHRQYYKMVHYDPSSRVPMIIRGPGLRSNTVYRNITSHVDVYPTIMEMANVTPPSEAGLDGRSLMPILKKGSDPGRRNAAISQFHGDEIHLSWFMIRKDDWKYVTYGSGQEVAPRLYNMTADPLEMNDLGTSMPDVVAELDKELRSYLDYPSVAADAESYNKESFVLFRDSFTSQAAYQATMMSIRWPYSDDPNACEAAISEWLKTPNSTFFWSL